MTAVAPASRPSEPEPLPRAHAVGLAAIALLADVGFLRALWTRFDPWGIWDWDFQLGLLEAARKTLVDHGELPLWNPWLGGGSTLVGNPLASTFVPSFVPVLLLGTIPGVKIVLLLYTWIAQIGTFRLGRSLGLGLPAATLAALVFAWGGVFAQHWTHGHIGWIGYAWLPWLLRAFHRASEPGALDASRGRDLAAGAVFLAFAWLDGGPYHYVLVPAFLASYAALRAAELRTARPLVALAPFGVLGFGLAALEILPIVEMVRTFPRPTEVQDHYYGAPFEPTALSILYQAFLSPAQAHEATRWQPFFLNVGAYVGLIPILLAVAALAVRPRRAWPWAVLTLGWLLICLGGALPKAIDPWPLVHLLPGMDSLQIPMRFRILPLLGLAVLAAIGLDALAARGKAARWRRIAAPALVAIVALDLTVVNGGVFRAAFVVPPIAVEPEPEIRYRVHRPYRTVYHETARVPLFPNWPTGALPTVMANQGMIRQFWPAEWPRATIPADHPGYPGAEVFAVEGRSRVASYQRTPNHVLLRVTGGGGTIVVNQNHHPGWRASVGEVVVFQGLLGVRVPPGPQAVRLSFRPRSFTIGAVLGFVSIGAVLFLALRRRRG